MAKYVLAGILPVLLSVVFVVSVAAAPDNKNTQSFDVSCDEPIGDITVSQNSDNSPTVFSEDGQVFVAKRITGTNNATITVEGGPTISLPPETFEEGSQGQGFEARLVSCEFTIEFEDTFTLKKRDVAFLGLGPEFIGATATFSGSTTGTAEVIVPGS
jgi:hypothetical protein